MKHFRNNHGIVIVYVTLFLMVLGVLFFALGVDIGWMVYIKSQGQKATDAAALAGAAAIPNANSSNSQTKVNEMALAFNSKNAVMNASAGITGTNVQLCDGNANANPPNCGAGVSAKTAAGVKVTRTYNAPLFFTRFVNGASSTNLTVSSTAWLGGPTVPCPTGGTACLPVAICDKEIHYDPNAIGGPSCDPSIITKFSPTGANNGAWWNKAGAGSSNAAVCKAMVAGTTPIPAIAIGDPLDLNNGSVNSCLQDIQAKYMNPPTSCSAAKCALAPSDPARIACTAILPIVGCQAGSPINMNNSPVLGFAAICIDDTISQGGNKLLSGPLNCNITAQGSLGGGVFSFGIYANKPVLVQ